MSEYLCPHCRQIIYDDEALLCLYCGESLGRRGTAGGGVGIALRKIIIIMIVALVLVSFVLLVLR